MEERPYITCRELIEFLHLYLAGELPADRAAEFDRHLSVCPSCVEYVATYRAAAALGRAVLLASDDPPGQEVPAELVAAIVRAGRGA